MEVIEKLFFYFQVKLQPEEHAYLKCNDLFAWDKGKYIYLSPLKYCGYHWLGNGKSVGRIIQILPYIKQYLKKLKEIKAFPEKNDWFLFVHQMVNSHLLLLMLEFSKSIMNVLELFLTLFRVERPLCSYIQIWGSWSFPWWIILFVLQSWKAYLFQRN